MGLKFKTTWKSTEAGRWVVKVLRGGRIAITVAGAIFPGTVETRLTYAEAGEIEEALGLARLVVRLKGAK